MRTTLNTIFTTLKAGARYIAPAILYSRKFQAGDLLQPKDVEDGTPIDLPRFGDDSLIHVLGGFPVKIASLSRGQYSSANPNAEFVHSRLGLPHYEVEILESGGAWSNYGRCQLPVGSKIHVDAEIFDGRFEIIPNRNPK